MPKHISPPDILTARAVLAHELAAALRVRPKTLTVWEREGRIPQSTRIGRKRIWSADVVARLLGTVQEGGAK